MKNKILVILMLVFTYSMAFADNQQELIKLTPGQKLLAKDNPAFNVICEDSSSTEKSPANINVDDKVDAKDVIVTNLIAYAQNQPQSNKLTPGKKLLVIGSPSFKVSCEDSASTEKSTIDTSEDNVVELFHDQGCVNNLYRLILVKKTQFNSHSEEQNCLLPEWAQAKPTKSVQIKGVCTNLKEDLGAKTTCEKLVNGKVL